MGLLTRDQAVQKGKCPGGDDTRLNPFFFFSIYIFIIYLFRLPGVLVVAHWILVAACGLPSCGMRVGSSSPTRDQT